MPRNTNKDSQNQEADEEQGVIGSPHVDRDVDDELDERSPQKSSVRKNEDEQDDSDDDDTAEDIDFDDLSAMEGPDA